MIKTQDKKAVQSMQNIDSSGHVSGKSVYVDDVPVIAGTLFARAFASPVAHGKIKRIDITQAASLAGVHRIVLASDIPGENQIGGIVPDEELLAGKEVHFAGMPVALVLAESEAIALKAVELIQIDIEPLPVITDPRKAHAAGNLIAPSRTFSLGDTKKAFAKCKHIFEGVAESGGQEHLYIETQGAYAIPQEGGNIKIISSTQGPTAVQRTAARVLGLAMHNIEVDVTRLGGGFGGKEDQASAWATMAALGAHLLKRPVKYVLHRLEDMKMTGKRHPYSSDYKIGLDDELNILAYEAVFFQNAGAAADLSPAVLERTLFHCNNSYNLPNVKATAHCCKTNLPPNTAFRGFGGPQGMFVIEAAIAHAAQELGVGAEKIQRKNLLKEGSFFPYGQIAKDCEAENCWDQAVKSHKLEKLKKEISAFNSSHRFYKKGFALMPVCFGISFTNTRMNNARALVHVYSDGSVGVSTGGVEMGQGINTKMLQVAASFFSIDPQKVKIESTNTTRVANTSPSAASSTADLNGKALAVACKKIKTRLIDLAAELLEQDPSVIGLSNGHVLANEEKTRISWEMLIGAAIDQRINLSAKGHYATPFIHFDKKRKKAIHSLTTFMVRQSWSQQWTAFGEPM